MVDMPKDCEQCRLQLMIEYNRLLAWGEAVGLIDVPQGSHVAVTLGTNAIELCSILSRMGWLLGEFKAINSRWKNELNPYQGKGDSISEEDCLQMNVAKEISSLDLAYEQTKEKRQHLRGTDHIIKWMLKRAGNAKELITHPRRVRWVVVDKEAFEALLKDIHSLIERVHELMGDYRVKCIHETTAKIYREMVLVRDDIKELKDMVEAVTNLIKISKGTNDARVACYNDHHEAFRDLLRLKEINRISDEVVFQTEVGAGSDIENELKALISVIQYDATSLADHFACMEGKCLDDSFESHRPRGTLHVNGTDLQVWLEWKTVENIIKDSAQERESRVRTAALAQMLHNSKPQQLYAPNCVGYVDDFKGQSRYGWVFLMPKGSVKTTTLKTLHSIFDLEHYKPTLTGRISLAWKLATSLQYLHTANWLHKGVHSGNVIFAFDGDTFDVKKPILSGFEYSRPQSNKTTSRSLDPKWDIYRWPRIQNDAPRATNSRKTYDIYSLGLILLEIAHWKPLHKILCLKRWPEPSAQDSRIRAWLLGEELYPPFKKPNPLHELRNIAGERYWKAVSRCLVAHGEMGMLIQEESDQARDSGTEIKLQEAFNKFVVEELKSLSI